jgi:diguanylate cyclase (GGDEF)-like protein
MAGTILIIDDSKIIRSRIIAALREAALFDTCMEAANGVEGLKKLAASPVDFVICDLVMPMMDGFKFLEAIRGNEKFRQIPVIILSDRGEIAAKVKGLRTGARDYLTKPFDPGELVARVMVQLELKALQDDMRKTNELLRELSNTDHLTHLYNRRYMMAELENEFERTLRKNGDLCLVFIDVDHFKLVNDAFGHQNGDMVLAAIAEALQVELRRYDIAARYGGEEFAMLLPDTSLKEGRTVAERLRRSVQEIVFPPPLEDFAVTISQGIAALPAPRITSVDSLIKAADEALYRAKRRGRNRVESAPMPT